MLFMVFMTFMVPASRRKDFSVDAWLAALLERHMRDMRRPEFLKAVRALSARYVERRAELPDRSPLDSAGKRAAFAAFYAPLHFLTVRAIARELQSGHDSPELIIDLGCGTGVAGAAWAFECAQPPAIQGTDLHAWAVDEARWNYRAMGLDGRAGRGDLLKQMDALLAPSSRPAPSIDRAGVMLGWSLNELHSSAREHAQTALIELARRGARVLVVEPIARRVVPWWERWAERAVAAGGRADEWRFDAPLPASLAELDEAAGFDREALTARSVAFNLTARP